MTKRRLALLGLFALLLVPLGAAALFVAVAITALEALRSNR